MFILLCYHAFIFVLAGDTAGQSKRKILQWIQCFVLRFCDEDCLVKNLHGEGFFRKLTLDNLIEIVGDISGLLGETAGVLIKVMEQFIN